MKSKISIFALSFATVCMMSSCLGDKDDTEVVTYDDTAITGLTLGTLKRYFETNGKKDSAEVEGSKYKLYIDQYSGTITNAPDSLPVGTNLKKIMFASVSALNGSSNYVFWKSLTSDSIYYFNSTTSIDFSQPRELYVFSTSGQYSKKYTVNIVAHKEAADSFKWNKLDIDNDIKNYTRVKAGICNNNLVVLGKTASGTEFKTLVDGSWKKTRSFSANATMTTDGNTIYVADGGVIYSSSDAKNWNTVSANVKSVIGVCGKEMFAMSNANKLMMSLDNGVSWKNENIDDDAKYIPSSDVNFVSSTTDSNADVKRAFVIGNSSANSKKAEVWSKIIEENAKKDQSWVYQNFNESNSYYLPRLSNLSVALYDKDLFAIGGECDKLYYSKDCGICWKENDKFKLPEGFSASTASIAVDDDNFIWIVCTGSGQVWKGRLNKMGWDNKE